MNWLNLKNVIKNINLFSCINFILFFFFNPNNRFDINRRIHHLLMDRLDLKSCRLDFVCNFHRMYLRHAINLLINKYKNALKIFIVKVF